MRGCAKGGGVGGSPPCFAARGVTVEVRLDISSIYHATLNSGWETMKDSLVAGSVSGALTRLFTCPLDVLKIRFQLQLEPISQVRLVSLFIGETKTMFVRLPVVPELQVQECTGCSEDHS